MSISLKNVNRNKFKKQLFLNFNRNLLIHNLFHTSAILKSSTRTETLILSKEDTILAQNNPEHKVIMEADENNQDIFENSFSFSQYFSWLTDSSENSNKLSLDSFIKWNSNRPLDNIGDITLNEMLVKISDLNILSLAEFGVKVVLAVSSFFTFYLLLRNYMKYIYTTPLRSDLTIAEREKQIKVKDRRLNYFIAIVFPGLFLGINQSSMKLLDLVIAYLPLNLKNQLEISQDYF